MLTFASSIASSMVMNLDTTRVTDAGSTRTVMIVSIILVVVAFALVGVTMWFWRRTIPDPDALESLAFFEERVIDGTEEASVPHRSRRRQVDGLRSARRRSE